MNQPGYRANCRKFLTKHTSYDLYFFFSSLMTYPVFQKKLKFYLFADDTNIYYETDTPDKLVKKVNTELKYVKRWLDANKLSLNINKTT